MWNIQVTGKLELAHFPPELTDVSVSPYWLQISVTSYFFTKEDKTLLKASCYPCSLPICLPPSSRVFTLLKLVCVLPSQDFVAYCLQSPVTPFGMCLNHQSKWSLFGKKKREYPRPGECDFWKRINPLVPKLKFQNYASTAFDLKLDPTPMLNYQFELVPSWARRVIGTFHGSKYMPESVILRARVLAFFCNAAPSPCPSPQPWSQLWHRLTVENLEHTEE